MMIYEKAVANMEKYAKTLKEYNKRGFVSVIGIQGKFSAYIKCMIDNELCGAGFGANEIEKFNYEVLIKNNTSA